MLALQNPHKQLWATIGDVFDAVQVLSIVVTVPDN